MFGKRKMGTVAQNNAQPELARQQQMQDANRGSIGAVNSGVMPVLSPADNGKGMGRVEERARKVSKRITITINTSAATAPVDVRLLGNIDTAADFLASSIKTDEGTNYTRTSPNGAIIVDRLIAATGFVTVSKIKIVPSSGVGDTSAGLNGRQYLQTGVMRKASVNEDNLPVQDQALLEQGLPIGNSNPNLFNTEFTLEPGMGRYDSLSASVLKAVPAKTILTVYLTLETVSGF